MKFIQGTDRSQLALFPTCLDDSLDFDNETRLIDLFVNSLDLKALGFEMDFIDNGRPAYHPGDLLRLFIYGYLNRIRSSRALEKECRRNIELIWLMKGLVPDHNTISNFRRDNPAAIKKVFRSTLQLAKHFELIGGTLIAGDSTKFRAQNSKKNTKGRGRVIERTEHQDYIDSNRTNVGEKEQLYKRRQAIIEHNYGTMRRQWNFHYIITKKGKDRASSDVGLIFTAYNLRRIFNLVDHSLLKVHLKALCLCFLAILDRFQAQKEPGVESGIFDWDSGSFQQAA